MCFRSLTLLQRSNQGILQPQPSGPTSIRVYMYIYMLVNVSVFVSVRERERDIRMKKTARK